MTIENKVEIIDKLKYQIASELEQSKRDLAEQNKAIDIDEEDVIESEDLSHASEAKDVQMMIRERVNIKQAALKMLDKEEFSRKHEAVDFGSIFESDNVLYVVGVDHQRFTENNQEVMPISIESPFFVKVRGFKKGDEVNFNGRTVRIDAIA